MKVQISTDRAIRILQYLHVNTGEVATAMTISQAVGVTYPFFIKIANQLKQNGLIGTVQGRHGGYQLAKSAEEISVYDVFLSTQGELKISNCLREDQHCKQGAVSHCRIHDFFCSLQDKMIEAMKKENIAGLSYCLQFKEGEAIR